MHKAKFEGSEIVCPFVFNRKEYLADMLRNTVFAGSYPPSLLDTATSFCGSHLKEESTKAYKIAHAAANATLASTEKNKKEELDKSFHPSSHIENQKTLVKNEKLCERNVHQRSAQPKGTIKIKQQKKACSSASSAGKTKMPSNAVPASISSSTRPEAVERRRAKLERGAELHKRDVNC